MRRLSRLLVFAALFLSSTTATAFAQDATSATGTAVVDGAEFTVAPGDVVAQGTLTSDGDTEACAFPEITLSTTADATVSEVAISAQVTEGCQLVIASIDKVASDNGETLMPATRYRGGAWAEQKDAPGWFVLTRIYTDMHYYDDGGSVWGGHNLSAWCETPTRDGWYIDSCAYDWNPGGSSSVSSWTIGQFGFWGGSYYHGLDGTFYGWPGGDWGPYCDYWGSFAPGAFLNCGGNHWVA